MICRWESCKLRLIVEQLLGNHYVLKNSVCTHLDFIFLLLVREFLPQNTLIFFPLFGWNMMIFPLHSDLTKGNQCTFDIWLNYNCPYLNQQMNQTNKQKKSNTKTLQKMKMSQETEVFLPSKNGYWKHIILVLNSYCWFLTDRQDLHHTAPRESYKWIAILAS